MEGILPKGPCRIKMVEGSESRVKIKEEIRRKDHPMGEKLS